MIALEHLLVATDFSEAADAALSCGRSLARAFGATLHVLHISENVFLGPIVLDSRSVEEAALNHLLRRLIADDRRSLHARAVVETSHAPAEAIIAYARKANIGLILMGTHGRTGSARLFVGSVAERVVRAAPCPVLTIRHLERALMISPRAADGALAIATEPVHLLETEVPMVTLKNILVPTDFGEAADAALMYAREIAGKSGATLHVIHVAENIFLKTYGETYGPLLADMQRDLEEGARKQLDELLIDSDSSGPPTRHAVLRSMSPFSTIVGYAADNDIDLIVMGTHGRGGFAHLMMGSVAERVVRLAPCPVLTVRHPEHEFVLPDTLATVARAEPIGI